MAPPIPGLRNPVPVRRRTAGDVGLGILAVIALAVLTAGVPVGLIAYFGSPVPHGLSLSTLTTQLDLTAILKILSVVVWLAWVQLIWCVLVEIRAAIRNVGVPGRVPLAGPTQSLANRLVTAALLLFSAAAALSPALPAHSAAPPRPAHSISVQARLPGQAGSAVTHGDALLPGHHVTSAGDLGHQGATGHHAATQDKVYVVKPPAGRYHESLWEIAHNHLGDGRRYHEIYELNKDHIQPDGTKLTKASLIRPGWVLRMPGDAHGPGIQTIAQHLGHDHQAPRPVKEDQHQVSQLGQQRAGAQDGSGSQGGSGSSAVAPQGFSRHVWPAELAAASLLAAGVLSALGRRRRQRLWQRAFGRRLAAPEGDAALAEQALRLGADDPATQLLDTSLRHLSRSLAASRKAPPTIFAAHLSAGELDLWVAPPDEHPPAPWTASDSGQVWRLPVAAASSLDADAALAPYPGLVTLGTSETGRIMVDLEAAHGLIAVHGPAGGVQAALAAIAVELVTSRWSDRMQVTLVGFGEGLELISPERARVSPALDAALADLEARAAALSDSLSAAGLDSVLTGRAFGGDPEAWAPHYLIVGVPPTPEQAQRLAALARVKQRTGIGIVVAGEVAGATWTWELTPGGRLRAGVLGFDVAAQLLPPSQYAAVVALFAATAAGGDPPLADPGADPAPAAHLVPGARFPVEVGLLGPVSVSALGPVDPDRLALCTEIVAYLAAHPGGVHPNVLAGAIWPRGVPVEVRDAVLARVAGWLGIDPAGKPNLVADPSGRLSLGADARVDWQVFRGLVTRAAASGDEAGCLERALGLVRGPVAGGRDLIGPGLAGAGPVAQYGWLATDDFSYEVTALVADTAHRLAVLRSASGDPAGAMTAARRGLRLAFDDEELWRDLLRAAHATGQEAVLRAAVDEVSARTALDEVMPRMAPQTEALIDAPAVLAVVGGVNRERRKSFMRRIWVLAGFLALATAGCSGGPGSSGADPNGMLPTTSAPAATAAVASSPAAASKLRYVMPPFGKGVSIQMTSWIPGDAEQARAVVADKNYELAFLYSEYKGGKDQQWTKYATAVMQREIASVLLAPDVTTESFTGTIRYFKMRVIPDPTVPGRVDVSSCFDNAKSSNTSLKTGAVLPDTGTASQHYVRITDQLAKGAAGEWQVAASLQPVYYPQAKECKP